MDEIVRVNLKDLRPNPWRDFHVDPIDHAHVRVLKESILESGFWEGGLLCTRRNGNIHLVFGHHRVAAAMECGIEETTVYVREDLSDEDLIRIPVTKANTAPGESRWPGAVVMVIKQIAKAAFTQDKSKVPPDMKYDLPHILKSLQSEKGLTAAPIGKFMKDMIDRESIKQILRSLKDSGIYARIIRKAADEVQVMEEA